MLLILHHPNVHFQVYVNIFVAFSERAYLMSSSCYVFEVFILIFCINLVLSRTISFSRIMNSWSATFMRCGQRSYKKPQRKKLKQATLSFIAFEQRSILYGLFRNWILNAIKVPQMHNSIFDHTIYCLIFLPQLNLVKKIMIYFFCRHFAFHF